MTDNNLKEFLEGKEAIPKNIYDKSLQVAIHSLNPKPVLIKFYASNLLGGLITLLICPQYGYGPMNSFFHYIMDYGPVWCGIFCAGIFFIGANTASMFILKKTELEWIATHKMSVLASWVSFLFFFGMLAKYYAPGHMHHTSVSHYMSWYVSALMITFGFFIVWKSRVKFSALS